MSPILTVFCIISAFAVFGHCQKPARTKEFLKAEIKKTQKNIDQVNEDNEKLSKQIKDEAYSCSSKVNVSRIAVNNGTDENNVLHSVLEDLYGQLSESYAIENGLRTANVSVEKLKLVVEFIQDNTKVLNDRRSSGMTKRCLELEDRVNGSERAKLSPRSKERIDVTIVLENELRLVLSELAVAKHKKSELKITLINAKQGCAELIKDLSDELKRIGNDNKKGKESIERVKKTLAEEKKIIEELEKTSKSIMKDLQFWKNEAKEQLDVYNALYALEVQCYEHLVVDAKQLVTSPVSKRKQNYHWRV